MEMIKKETNKNHLSYPIGNRQISKIRPRRLRLSVDRLHSYTCYDNSDRELLIWWTNINLEKRETLKHHVVVKFNWVTDK